VERLRARLKYGEEPDFEVRHRTRKLLGACFHLLFQVRVRGLELLGHAIEGIGKYLKFIASVDINAAIQLTYSKR
jgi:hypothetical protein